MVTVQRKKNKKKNEESNKKNQQELFESFFFFLFRFLSYLDTHLERSINSNDNLKRDHVSRFFDRTNRSKQQQKLDPPSANSPGTGLKASRKEISVVGSLFSDDSYRSYVVTQ